MSLEAFLESAIRRAVREEMRALLVHIPQAASQAVSEFLSVEDIAKSCDVQSPAVCSWIRSGRLLASKPSRRYVIRRKDFEAFLAKREADAVVAADPDEQVNKILGRIRSPK